MSVSGTTYWVHPSGNNANSGDSLHPWATPNHACSTIVAGDTTFVRGDSLLESGGYFGRYAIKSRLTSFDEPGRASIEFLHNGTAENPIVISNYPGDSIELKRSMVGNTGNSYLNALIGFYNNSYCVINGFTIYTYIDTIMVTAFNCVNSNYCRFENCNAYGINRYQYILTDQNLNGACGYYNHSGFRLEGAKNCCITDCKSIGFTCFDGSTCNVNNNCILYYRDTSCTTQYCYVADGCETIRDKWYGTDGSVFINNIILDGPHHCGGLYIEQHPQSNTIVRNNIIINGGIFGVSGIESSHEYNIVSNNTIVLHEGSTVSTSSGIYSIAEQWTAAVGNEFYNNIIWDEEAVSRSVIKEVFKTTEVWHVDTNLFDYCNYNIYRTGKFKLYLDLPIDDISTTFSTWKTRFGNDINGDTISISPFVNVDLDSLQLKPDSPLRNSGRYGLHIGAYSTDETVVGPRTTAYQPPQNPSWYVDTTGYKRIFVPNRDKIRVELKYGSPPLKIIIYNKYGNPNDSTETNDSIQADGAGIHMLVTKTLR